MALRLRLQRLCPAAPPRLDTSQKSSLVQLLEQCPNAHGFASGNWTYSRIAHFNPTRFGVAYNASTFPKFLSTVQGYQRPRPQFT